VSAFTTGIFMAARKEVSLVWNKKKHNIL